jgi:hypothetical protein
MMESYVKKPNYFKDTLPVRSGNWQDNMHDPTMSISTSNSYNKNTSNRFKTAGVDISLRHGPKAGVNFNPHSTNGFQNIGESPYARGKSFSMGMSKVPSKTQLAKEALDQMIDSPLKKC